jgi:DNA invertase Pin-like site-specific DNA recombinase
MTAFPAPDPPSDPDYGDEWADIGYTRISDDRTGEAASPARQRRKITDAVADEGHAITHWFEDLSKSAYKPGVVRADFEELLKACEEHPVRRVWVLHDDRLIRDGDDTDLPRLIRVLAPRKITIRCTEAADIKLWQAEGKMTARFRNAVNAYESERKRERVMLATEDRARKGRFPGGQRRFGYKQRDTRVARRMDEHGTISEEERPTGPLVLVPEEAEAIASGYRLIASGASLYAVVKDWRSRGLVGPQGAEFTDVSVRDVLLRAANAGLSMYKGEVVGTGDWPAITDPDTFATVKAILEDPSRRRGVGKPATTLLSGLLKCTCGARMNGSNRGDKRGSSRLIYRCRKMHVTRARDKLDDWVSEQLIQHLIENADRLTQSATSAKPNDTVARAVKKAAELRGQIDAYQARADQFDPDDLAGLLRVLRAKLDAEQRKIVRAAGRPATRKLLGSPAGVKAAWDRLDTADKRVALKENITKIVVGRGRPGAKNATTYNVAIDWRQD